jgi:hypothetical protein
MEIAISRPIAIFGRRAASAEEWCADLLYMNATGPAPPQRHGDLHQLARGLLPDRAGKHQKKGRYTTECGGPPSLREEAGKLWIFPGAPIPCRF